MKNFIVEIHRTFGPNFAVGPFTEKDAESFLKSLGFKKNNINESWHLTNWGSAVIGQPMTPEEFKENMNR